MTLDTETPRPQPKRKRPWLRRILVGGLLLIAGGTAGFALGTQKAAAFFFHGFESARLDPQRLSAKVDRRVDRVLSRVDATDDQKTKVAAIIKGAITDLAALGFNPRDARAKTLALFRADTVEPQAFETLRNEQAVKFDEASKRITRALTEAAAVLTPEQRRALTERWYRRMAL